MVRYEKDYKNDREYYDRDYIDNRYTRDRDRTWDWLPLLIIPLLLLGGALWYFNYPRENNSNIYNNVQPGVGGGPNDNPGTFNSPIPSPTTMVSPTVTDDDTSSPLLNPTSYTMP